MILRHRVWSFSGASEHTSSALPVLQQYADKGSYEPENNDLHPLSDPSYCCHFRLSQIAPAHSHKSIAPDPEQRPEQRSDPMKIDFLHPCWNTYGDCRHRPIEPGSSTQDPAGPSGHLF